MQALTKLAEEADEKAEGIIRRDPRETPQYWCAVVARARLVAGYFREVSQDKQQTPVST